MPHPSQYAELDKRAFTKGSREYPNWDRLHAWRVAGCPVGDTPVDELMNQLGFRIDASRGERTRLEDACNELLDALAAIREDPDALDPDHDPDQLEIPTDPVPPKTLSKSRP